jgi:hypothetical protein
MLDKQRILDLFRELDDEDAVTAIEATLRG